MQRDLARLGRERFDVAVVGGGIFGACVARDAALRGLHTALLEKRDFGGAASANSFRMVHGGIRYLQHLDVRRLRQSSRERAVLLRTAPHLVHPLPIVVPTYGSGLRGRALLKAGFVVYDLLTPDRNRGIGLDERRIPPCRMLSHREVLQLFPGLEREGLTGAGVFHDAQMHHPARLELSILRSAADAGAVLANYADVTGLSRHGEQVVGVTVEDREKGGEMHVRADVVIVAAGAWTDPLLTRWGVPPERPALFSRDLCLVTDIPADHDYGLAVTGEARDPDALLSRRSRHLFVVPWRGRLIVGVWHRTWQWGPERIEVTEREIETFVREVDDAYPALGLTHDRVTAYNTGLVLLEGRGPDGFTPHFGKRSRIRDHRRDGVHGLVSLVGVRYTTARHDAESALEVALSHLDRGASPCTTDRTPLFGGDIESMDDLRSEAANVWPSLPADAVEGLCRGYGSQHVRVHAHTRSRPELRAVLPATAVVEAEVLHAVREEMALHLDDVVLRRTALGLGGDGRELAIDRAARIMAEELGWDEPRREREKARTGAALRGPGSLVSTGTVPADEAS